MDAKRAEYVQEVLNFVRTACETLADDVEHPIEIVLNISEQDAYHLITKIIIALPDQFLHLNRSILTHNMLAYISKEFILFQSQENISDPNYLDYFVNFIYATIFQISNSFRKHKLLKVF